MNTPKDLSNSKNWGDSKKQNELKNLGNAHHSTKTKKMQDTATLKTISEKTGYSIATISRALKDGPEVKPETKALIKQAAEELGYSPNLSGIHLRTGKTNSLCIVLPSSDPEINVGDSGYISLVEGISQSIKDTSYNLMVQPIPAGHDPIEPVYNLVKKRLVDGIILTQTRPQDTRVRFLLEKSFPFVAYGRAELYSPFAYYDTDHEDMAYRATQRLASLGHQRIAMLNPKLTLTYACHRLTGYKRALAESGLAYDPELFSTSDLGVKDGVEQVSQLCRLKNPPTAYLCSNEYLALGALHAFYKEGIVFGKDATIVSTDDSDFSAYYTPPLSTYYSSLTEAGRVLGNFLLRVIDGEDPQNLQKLDRAQLIERNDDRFHPV